MILYQVAAKSGYGWIFHLILLLELLLMKDGAPESLCRTRLTSQLANFNGWSFCVFDTHTVILSHF